MKEAKEFSFVMVTCDTIEISQRIAKTLVAEQLAACCTMIPGVVSVFGWHGAVHERTEYMLMIKTAKYKLDELERRVRELHTDEVPEIISICLDKGHEKYLNWIEGMVNPKINLDE